MPTRTADDQTTAKTANEHAAAELRAEAARQGLTQTELAERLDETQSWVSRRLTGDVAITVDELVRFAQVLGVRAARLLPPDDLPAPRASR